MEEKDLIKNLALLKKETAPRKEWVCSVRESILGREVLQPSVFEQISSVFKVLERPAFVLATLVLLVGGGFAVQAQKSLPGDSLYALRAMKDRMRVSVASEGDRAFLYLGLAKQRLGDIEYIAQNNKEKNLEPALKEFNASVAEVSRELRTRAKQESKRALQTKQEIVELHNEQKRVGQLLGILMPESSEQLHGTTRLFVEQELADLVGRLLTQEQTEIVEEAKEAIEKEDYQTAFEKLFVELETYTDNDDDHDNDNETPLRGNESENNQRSAPFLPNTQEGKTE